ncbi:MAG: T9SS type A sorting domain-containing protein [Bacteroidia bacterium]
MKNKFLLFALIFYSFQIIAQESWTKMASLPGPGRNHAIAFSHGTKGYVMTGEDASLMKDFWEYDSGSDTWKELPNYPGAARSYGIGYTIGDKAYIGLGHSSSGALLDWWEYDFNTSTWNNKASFPGPGRDHPACAEMNGKIYLGFGDRGSTQYKDWWQYDPTNDTWTQKTTYPGYKMHHPVAAQDSNLVYITEGHIEEGTQNHGSIYSYSYNAANDTWTQLANMPGPGVVAGASFYIGNNKIYSGIGITEPESAFHKEFYAYDISAGKWSTIASYPGSGRFAPVSFVIGNAGYIATGMTSANVSVQDLYKLSYLTTGLEKIKSSVAYSVYPNPATSEFTITNITRAENFHYSLYTLLGAEIKSGYLTEAGKVNVSDLSKGIYLIKVNNGKNGFTKKVIIQ